MESMKQIINRVDTLNEAEIQINALRDILNGLETDAITSMEITLQWKD